MKDSFFAVFAMVLRALYLIIPITIFVAGVAWIGLKQFDFSPQWRPRT